MSTNPFTNILSDSLKTLYNNAIDAVVNEGGLAMPCGLSYAGQQNQNFCNNCVYDPISKLSANIYNGTGPNPFPDGGVCPVCMGNGVANIDTAVETTTVYLAVILTPKDFFPINNQIVNMTDGEIQTICHVKLAPQLRNCIGLTLQTDIDNYGGYTYERASDPTPAGFGSHRYIITMWKRK